MAAVVNRKKTPFENLLKLVNSKNSPTLLATDVEFLWPYTTSGNNNTSITVSALATGRFPGSVQCSYNRLDLAKLPYLLTGAPIKIAKTSTLEEAKATVVELLGLDSNEIIFYYAALPTWGTTYWAVGCLWSCLIYCGNASVPVVYK